MTNKELAALFLRNYANDLSNRGCNDFYLQDTPENRELVQAAIDWSGDPNSPSVDNYVHGDDIIFYDWLIVKYLASTLEIDK